MTAEPLALRASGLGKAFARGSNQLARLMHVVSGTEQSDAFWALRDVDLEVGRGSAVGVVGRNGSGKSTLLQILCGTMEATRGSVQANGRVSAMLELGAGFDPQFTGRENVRLNATTAGLDADAIAARMDAIAGFADIGAYFDRPVQEYSTGMQARLAFAVAIHADADILVVDEVLGVGDAAFQRKCRSRMHRFRENGGTILFVSHDPGAVAAVCERAIWLDGGRKVADGDSASVTKAYAEAMYEAALSGAPDSQNGSAPAQLGPDIEWGNGNTMRVSAFRPETPRFGFGGCEITDCHFTQGEHGRRDEIGGGEVVTLCIRARAERRLESPIAGFMFRDAAGQNLFGDNTYLTYHGSPPVIEAGAELEARLTFLMPYLPDGRYAVAPSIIEGTQFDHIHLDWREEAVFVDVTGSPVEAGKMGLPMRRIETVRISDAG